MDVLDQSGAAKSLVDFSNALQLFTETLNLQEDARDDRETPPRMDTIGAMPTHGNAECCPKAPGLLNREVQLLSLAKTADSEKILAWLAPRDSSLDRMDSWSFCRCLLSEQLNAESLDHAWPELRGLSSGISCMSGLG